jgi:hypothetical protein
MLLEEGHRTSRDAYNFYHSSHRVHVEQAFGRRWGILWSSLRYDLPRNGVIVGAAMRLQNWCIDEGAQVPRGTPQSDAEVEDSFRRWWSNATALREVIASRQGTRSDLHASRLREMLVEQLADTGAMRPLGHH